MPDNISHTEYRLGNERLYRQAEYDALKAEAARLRREYDVATESYRISNDILAKALGGPETSPEYDMALKHHVWARRAAAAIERLRAEVARLSTWKEDADKALREEWRQRLLAFITGDGLVCVYCMEMTHDPDHWKSCPKHPARAEVERLQAELVTAKLQLADCIGDLSLSAELRRRLQASVRVQIQTIDGQRAEVERLKADLLALKVNKAREDPGAPEPTNAGIYGKYIIQKMDGSPFDSQAVYFVLRLDTDPAARAAALAYSNQTTDTKLADDLRRLVGIAHLRHNPTGKEA